MATMEELANQVAHATTGKDVREAIAQGFEHLKDINDRIDKTNSRIDKLNERLDELMNGGGM